MIRKNMKWGLLVAIFTFSACNNTEEIENGGTNSKSKVTIEIAEVIMKILVPIHVPMLTRQT